METVTNKAILDSNASVDVNMPEDIRRLLLNSASKQTDELIKEHQDTSEVTKLIIEEAESETRITQLDDFISRSKAEALESQQRFKENQTHLDKMKTKVEEQKQEQAELLEPYNSTMSAMTIPMHSAANWFTTMMQKILSKTTLLIIIVLLILIIVLLLVFRT